MYYMQIFEQLFFEKSLRYCAYYKYLQYLCSAIIKQHNVMDEKQLTEKEAELIEAIRNLKKSKHNPSLELEIYVRQLFDELLEN